MPYSDTVLISYLIFDLILIQSIGLNTIKKAIDLTLI